MPKDQVLLQGADLSPDELFLHVMTEEVDHMLGVFAHGTDMRHQNR